MCKKHWAESANLKVNTNNENISSLKSKCVEIPNASYTKR